MTGSRQPYLLRPLAYLLSLLGHPLFILIYLLLLYLKVNPYLFPYGHEKDMDIMVLKVFIYSAILPSIGILLLVFAGFAEGVELRKRTERIAPLMMTGVFYIWLYLNIRTHSAIPIPYSTFVLGSLFGMALAFFVNNFSKISLHAVGLGGFFVGVVYLFTQLGQGYMQLAIGASSYEVHYIFILAILVVLIAMILTSRLYLRAHDNEDIYGGFLVGVMGQVVAYMFF